MDELMAQSAPDHGFVLFVFERKDGPSFAHVSTSEGAREGDQPELPLHVIGEVCRQFLKGKPTEVPPNINETNSRN